MRSHPSGNYLIFYRIQSGTIRVVRVLHGKRDIPKILRT
jgi:plasmid stabilization system protein ParE